VEIGAAALGNIIRSTVVAPHIQTGLRPISSAEPQEAIRWRIAKQMPDSGNRVESAIALQAGLAIEAESAIAAGLGITAVGLEIIVETGEAAVLLLVPLTEVAAVLLLVPLTAVAAVLLLVPLIAVAAAPLLVPLIAVATEADHRAQVRVAGAVLSVVVRAA